MRLDRQFKRPTQTSHPLCNHRSRFAKQKAHVWSVSLQASIYTTYVVLVALAPYKNTPVPSFLVKNALHPVMTVLEYFPGIEFIEQLVACSGVEFHRYPVYA